MFRSVWRVSMATALITSLCPAPTTAGEPYRIQEPSVQVVCELTVGGTFEARTKAIAGQVSTDPGGTGAVNGIVTVDLRTLETGIKLRDSHLRDRYLEVGKSADYAMATLKNIRLQQWAPNELPLKTLFRANLTLHGVESSVAGVAEISGGAGNLKLQARFPVHVASFGIEPPMYLGVGLKDDVVVNVAFKAVTAPLATTANRGASEPIQVASSRSR